MPKRKAPAAKKPPVRKRQYRLRVSVKKQGERRPTHLRRLAKGMHQRWPPWCNPIRPWPMEALTKMIEDFPSGQQHPCDKSSRQVPPVCACCTEGANWDDPNSHRYRHHSQLVSACCTADGNEMQALQPVASGSTCHTEVAPGAQSITSDPSVCACRTADARNAEGEFVSLPFATSNPWPVYSGGAPIGHAVKQSLKTKIWEHKYIDLADLLYPNTSRGYDLAVQDEEKPALCLEPKKRKFLSEQDWSAAFDVFIAIYLEKYPSELNGILTYAQHVKDLMRNGTNWPMYDSLYRQEREFTKCSWHIIRQDLELRAFRITLQRSSKFNTSQPKLPKGFCYAYHKRAHTATSKIVASNTSAPVAVAPIRNTHGVTLLETPPSKKLPTPVKAKVLSDYLRGYIKADYITSGFTEGFMLNFEGEESPLHSNNSVSVTNNEQVVAEKIRKELDMGRIEGPFLEPPFDNFKCSPLSVREKREPGKYRLLHNLSYPYNEDSVNFNIPKERSTVQYAHLKCHWDGSAVWPGMLHGKKRHRGCFADWWPLHPSQYHLTGFQCCHWTWSREFLRNRRIRSEF